MSTVKDMIKNVNEGGTLDAMMSEALFDAVFSGDVSEIELSAVLTAMRVRKETPEEIIGAARSMRKFATRLDVGQAPYIDTCGTGGDHSYSFNVSTAVALTLAAMGVPVAKHGNRSVSSTSGSADFLEAVGVPINLTGDEAAAFFERHRFVFMFAPNYHPAMKHAAPVRRALGIRTIFNYLGPITNPAFPGRQMIGVFNPDALPLYSQVVAGMGYERVLLYSAEGGMDEVSPVKPTMVYEVFDGRVRFYTIIPEQFIKKDEASKLPHHLSAGENAAAFLDAISSGLVTPLAKFIALNTALALYLHRAGGESNFSASIKSYFQEALAAITGGKVSAAVERMRARAEEAVHA